MRNIAIGLLVTAVLSGCASVSYYYSPPVQKETATLKLVNFKNAIQLWMFLDARDCRQRKIPTGSVDGSGNMDLKIAVNEPITIRWSHSLQGSVMSRHSWCEVFFTFTPSKSSLYTLRTKRFSESDGQCGVALEEIVNGIPTPVSGSEKPILRKMKQPFLEDGPWCRPI